MIDLADIERVVALSKTYLTERKKYERLSEKALAGGMSPKQAQKASTDLNWQAMALEKIEVELHIACVDASIADLRDERHYGERIFRPSGWHEYNFTPTKPRCFSRRAAA